MSDDPKRNLETIALFAGGDIRDALTAAFVMSAAEAFFYQDQQRFRTHVANNLVFHSLRALEASAVVHLAETVRDEHRLHPLANPVRGLDALLRHRDMISHPLTVRWRRPDRQQFADRGHQWIPIRAGLVWDVAKAIDEMLVANDMARTSPDVPATPEMARTLNLILSLAGWADAWPAELLLAYLEKQKPGFIRLLEQHPDGTLPPDAGEDVATPSPAS
jgi:hypothetical protein